MNPIGGAARWSWKWLTYQKAWTAFWRRFASQPFAAWSHEQRCAVLHAPAAPRAAVKSVNAYVPGTTSSVGAAVSTAGSADWSSMSLQAWANGPRRVVAPAVR